MGVVLCVAPWNYPLLTAVNTIVPALMAGNAVALKHASQTLVVGERLQEAAGTAGLPGRDLHQPRPLPPAGGPRAGAARVRPGELHRVGRGRPDHRTIGGRHLRRGRPGAGRQGPGLRPGRRRPGAHGRERGGWSVLQLGPVVLRDRAGLRPPIGVRSDGRRHGRSGRRLPAGVAARPRDDAGADGDRPRGRRGAGPDRCRHRGGGHRHRRTERVRRHRRRSRIALPRPDPADRASTTRWTSWPRSRSGRCWG